MDRIPMAVGGILMAILLATAPVAATTPLAFEDHPSSGAGSAVPSIGSGSDSQPVGSSLNEMNDSSTGSEDTTTGDSTTTDGSWGMTANTIIPCCGGGTPTDKEPWQFDANYDREINWSEKEEAEQEYDAGTLTEESYDKVKDAYYDDETVLYPDPDGDGMTIREEEVWSDHSGEYFSKDSTNLDDDQFSDFADPRPNTEDIPPNISVSFPDGIWDSYVNFTFSDESGIDEWEIIERYEYRGELHRIVQPKTSFGVHQRTDNITVRAVDNNGNEREILLNITENDDVRLMKSEIATAALPAAGHYTGGSVIGSLSGTAGITVAGLGVAGFTSALIAAPISQLFKGKNTDGTIEKNIASTTSSQVHTNFYYLASSVQSAVGASTVTLPAGYSDSVSDPAGGTLHRGYGHEFLSTTSVDLAGVHALLTTEAFVENVYENGEKTVVIGDNGLGKTIAVTIIGGVVQAASSAAGADEYTNDPCDGRELVDLEHEEEHYTRNPDDSPEKPYDDKSEVKQLLDDGIDKAFEVVGGSKRYYIKKVGANKWTVIVLEAVTGSLAEQMVNGFTDRLVKTFLTDTDDGKQFFDSLEEAEDAINEPTDEINC